MLRLFLNNLIGYWTIIISHWTYEARRLSGRQENESSEYKEFLL